MRRRTTSLLSKRYPKRRTTLKRPSDFLLRDTHDDVLEADEFKQLWWRIKENLNEGLGVQGAGMPATAVTKTAMAIVQNCAAHRVLHVKQLCSIIKLFDTDSGRLEVLEFFVLRAHKLSFKGDIIPLFQLPLRPYVSDILESAMLVEPTEGIPQGAMLFRNKLRKSRSIVHAMLSALERIHFNRSNQNNVINAILSRNCLPLSHRQAFRILGNFVDDIPTLLNVIDLIDRHVIGFTCREISLLLNRIAGVRDRVTVLTKVASMILDSEHRWIALDAGFGDDVDTEIREDVAHFLHNLSVLPRSFVFGTVTARTVCFVVDTTSSMSATFITNQGERITRLRFVMRELTRVLRHQLSESTRFNIVAFSAEATAWSASGAVEASKMNVRMACDWLRDLKAVGPTHVFEALSLAFESCGEGLEAVYVVTDGDPSRGMDTEMDKICNAPRLDLTQFTKAPRVHVSGIVLGNHDFDNAAQTETWVRDLATWGGGIARFLVDDTYDNTASSGSVRSSSLRPPVKHGTGAVWQVANLCSFVLLCLLIWVTQFSGLRGTGGIATRRTYADMNSLFPTFLLPLDALFRAWYILLVFMGLNVLYMCRWPLCCYNQNQRRRQKNSVAKMSSKGVQLFVLRCQLGMTNWKLPAWHLITCVWIIANQAEVMVVALVCAFLDLILLVSLHQSLRIGKHPMKYDVLQDMRLSQKERDTVGSATNSSVEGGSGSGGVGGDADEGSGANRDDDDDAPTDRPSLFNRPNGVLWSERLFMGIPISAGLSLVSFLVCIQFGQYLQTWEWFGWGWQEEWALVLICLLFSVGFLFAVVLDDAVFGAVTAITHFGVALNNFSESRSIGDLSKVASVSDFSYGFMIYVGTMTSAITLTVLALKPIAKGYAELLYKTLFKKLRSADTKVHEQAEVKSLAHKAQTITWRQTFVFSMWFLTVVVSLLADESVNKIMLSLETPFINHMTFLGVTRLTDFPAGDVGQFVGAIRAMPSTFFFGVFFVVYGLLLMYVLLQALPLEQLGRNVDYLREEDMALEKHVFVRGTRQRWSKRKLCCGCRRLPLVHKWRLTPRASDLLIGDSGTFFLFSCLLNILFVVCYLHKQYLAALICFLLLFFTVIAWYLKVKAWHISPDPKSKEEIARLKQEFEQAHANEPAEIMAEKWDAVERRKTKIPRHVSSVETFVLHVPISAYLGLLAFMVVFISSQFTVLYVGVGPGVDDAAAAATGVTASAASTGTSATSTSDTSVAASATTDGVTAAVTATATAAETTEATKLALSKNVVNSIVGGFGWNMGDWYEEGWAWSMVGLAALVVLAVSFKNSDPVLPLSFSVGTFGMFIENSVGTCSWDSPAGVAIRKPDMVNANQRIKPLKPDSGPNEYYQRGGMSGGRLHWFWNLTDDTGAFVDSGWTYAGEDTASDTAEVATALVSEEGQQGFESTAAAEEADRTQAAYWCKRAVELGHNNGPDDGPAWAFRYQDGKHFTYYDETRNKDGDYVYLQGRCRRIYKNAENAPITASEECQNLGTQRPGNPDVVRGFFWIDDLCVEDPGTCSFVHGKSPMTSHTPEYILAMSSLWTSLILWVVGLLIFVKRLQRHKGKQAKLQEGENIFAADLL